MREELDLPPESIPSYRVRRPRGMDANTKRLVLAAGAIAAALVVLVGAYAIVGHRPSGTPEIAADTRPLRTKPENPGGMQIAGQNDAIMGAGPADSEKAAEMAPPPETPQPQALQAQERQARAEAARAAQPASPQPARPEAAPAAAARPAPAPAVATAPVATTTATPADARHASTPAAPTKVALVEPPAPPRAAPPAPSRAAAAPAAATAPAAGRLTGHAAVQLASLTTEAGARTEWERLNRKMPDLLRGRQPVVSKAEAEGRTFWRLRTAGFADASQARAFCDKVKAQGGGCTVATF